MNTSINSEGTSSVSQTCSCPCGHAKFEVLANPAVRFFCHCSICQKLYKKAFADVTVLKSSNVVLPEPNNIIFKKHRRFIGIERGTCNQCEKPVIAMAGSGGKGLAFIAAENYSVKKNLPVSEMHIFYDRRTADVADNLPKHSGYIRSQLAAFRFMNAQMPK